MISCTEFIPAYSEIFTFLEKNYGKSEVEAFWDYLFKPDGNGIPLINFVKKEGIRGCFTYWTGTLNEEAANFSMYLNEKEGYFLIDMHRCPSKGRLLELQEEIGIVPYHDYCSHCKGYKQAVEKIGLEYHYDFTGVDHASCCLYIYDPKKFKGVFRVDENTEVMHRNASDNEYFHRDFHSSMNMGVDYVASKFGEAKLVEYLHTYAKNMYQKFDFSEGLASIERLILSTYEKEKAPDAVKTSIDGDTLLVKVSYCPAVKHLIARGSKVSKWFSYTTTAVMEKISEMAGVRFEMLSYDDATGAAEYKFTKN